MFSCNVLTEIDFQFPENMPQIYPNNNSQKRGNARLPKLFVVELQVGDKVYSAEGRTRQQAKHEAVVQGNIMGILVNFYEFFISTRFLRKASCTRKDSKASSSTPTIDAIGKYHR